MTHALRLCILGLAAIAGGCKREREQLQAPTAAVSESARTKFSAGVEAMDKGAASYETAISAFKSAIALEPKLWEAWLNVGIIELRRARLGEAAAALQKSVDIYASPEALEALGDVYARQGRNDRAVGLFERALERNPGDIRLRNALAIALRHAQRLDEAEAEVRAILGQKAFDPDAYATLAAIEIDRDQLELAELVLNKGLARNPDHPLLLTNLGLLAMRRGDDQTAMQHFEKASVAAPKFVTGRLNRAAIFLGVGDFKRAQGELDVVLSIEPGNLDALVGVGIAKRLAGDRASARASWQSVLAIDSSHAAAHFNLGILAMDFDEQPQEARKHLERYLQVAGNDDDAHVAAAKERLALLESMNARKGGS